MYKAQVLTTAADNFPLLEAQERDISRSGGRTVSSRLWQFILCCCCLLKTRSHLVPANFCCLRKVVSFFPCIQIYGLLKSVTFLYSNAFL